MSAATLPATTVIGLGCGGGSIALSLRAAGHSVSGWDSDLHTRHAARARGVVAAATIDEACRAADVVVVAAPPAHCAALVAQALLAAPAAWVTDVASIKAPVIASVRRRVRDEQLARYVPAHPMAGGTGSGFAAARPGFSAGETWAVCPIDGVTDIDGICAVGALIDHLDASMLTLDARAHDAAVARCSHLTQVIATALAPTGADALVAALAPRSYREQTRLADSSPALWGEILRANRRNAPAALDDLTTELAALRAAMDECDEAALEQLMRRAATGREGTPRCECAPWMHWRGPASCDALMRLGRAGRRIRALRRAGDDLTARIQNIP